MRFGRKNSLLLCAANEKRKFSAFFAMRYLPRVEYKYVTQIVHSISTPNCRCIRIASSDGKNDYYSDLFLHCSVEMWILSRFLLHISLSFVFAYVLLSYCCAKEASGCGRARVPKAITTLMNKRCVYLSVVWKTLRLNAFGISLQSMASSQSSDCSNCVRLQCDLNKPHTHFYTCWRQYPCSLHSLHRLARPQVPYCHLFSIFLSQHLFHILLFSTFRAIRCM